MCQHFNLTIDPLPEKYNCEARLGRGRLKKAALVHAVGHRKFWKYYYFQEWFELYREWVREGGQPCNNRFTVFTKLHADRFPLFQAAPDPLRYPVKFLCYLLRALFRCKY